MEVIEKAQQYLKEFRAIFEPYFSRYLNERIIELAKTSDMGRLLTEKIFAFSGGGGKRIRAALVVLGYQAGGGNKMEDVFPAAAAVELLHNFFLVHDDIIDLSDVRRARPTMHKMFEQWSSQILKGDVDQRHFCHSMAMLAGDMSCVVAIEALTSVSLPAERIVQAFRKLCAIGCNTVIGQGLDVTLPFREEVSEEAVMQIYLLKTAKYTVEGPLHIGLLLAGADNESLEEMSRYAIPVGIAFQIQDDILGVFGTEEELGKSVTSDIKEGKQTLLTVAARKFGSAAHRERLNFLLGNSQISPADIEEARKIMRLSGALAYSRSRAQSLAEKGKAELKQMSVVPEIEQILEGIADYIVERTF